MDTRNIDKVKVMGEGVVKILTTILSAEMPLLAIVSPGIDAVKGLKTVEFSNSHISFAQIEKICEETLPDHVNQYKSIVSVAADICLRRIDFLTNPYETKEYSAKLTNQYVREHSDHYSEEELHQIRMLLPRILEIVIPDMERRLENDDFSRAWRKVVNNRIAGIEERQDAQEMQLASYEARIRHQEEHTKKNLPKISELSDSYSAKWDSALFLDRDRILSQVYQLPNYQSGDYWNDEDVEATERYSDLNARLEETLFNCNNLKTRMLLVLGHPGSGKSTLITYLLNSFLFDSQRTVRVYRFSGFESINWNSDPENIPQLMLNDMGLVKADLNNSVLILDGLDEVQMHNHHEEFLNHLYQQWANSKELKRFSVIVTCRRNRIDSIGDLQMRYVLLSPLDEMQIEQFASAYWEKDVRDFDGKQMALIERIKNSSRRLKDVLGIPLILYMALSLEIDLSEETGLCDIYENIFSVENKKNSIYYRRYDKTHPITSVEAEKIHEFSKEVARLIWEFSPAEGAINREKYEPVASRIAPCNEEGLRELLIGQYFMEGKDGCQLLFVHRSMYEYFIALSICDAITEIINSALDLTNLNVRNQVSGGNRELSTFANVFGLQNLMDYPEIQEFLIHMLEKKCQGNQRWWHVFFAYFLSNGLSDAASSRPKGGPFGLNEELNRFYNLIWLTREQLEFYGEPAPHLLSDDLCKSIYFRIPYDGKKDLRNICLNGIELLGCDFVEAQLEEASLCESVLDRSNFSEANLRRADFRSAEIEQATFSFASLYGADFSYARLKAAQFVNADLRYADFSGADLSGADFSHADLSCAVFSGATLINANFSNAVIENCNFDGANMTGSRLTKLRLKNTSFVNTNFTKALLDCVEVTPETSMKNANFSGCNLSGSDFRHVDLSFAEFENAIMSEMYLCGSDLRGANLRGAELSNSNLERVSLVGAQLKNALIDNANLKYANLENADLRGARMMYTDLTSARLIETKVKADTLDAVICGSGDRAEWDVDDSLDFGKTEDGRLIITGLDTSELIEVDDNIFVDLHKLEEYERQCREDSELIYPYSAAYWPE